MCDKLGTHLDPLEGESTAFGLKSTCEKNFLVAVLSHYYNSQRAGAILSLTEKMLVLRSATVQTWQTGGFPP